MAHGTRPTSISVGDSGRALTLRVACSGSAARRLAELLTQQGRGEEAKRLRWFGLAPYGSTARGRRTTGIVSRPPGYRR